MLSFRISSGVSLAPYRSTYNAWQQHTARISQGRRIISSADDAAGLSISTKMQARIRGLRMQMRNLQDNLSMLQTADGALNESTQLLQRLRELAVQAGSPILHQQDRSALQMEAAGILDALRTIACSTHFNNKPLMNRQTLTHTELRTVEQSFPPAYSLLGEAASVGQLMGDNVVTDTLVAAPSSSLISFKAPGLAGKAIIYDLQTGSSVVTSASQAPVTTGSWVSNGQNTYLVINEKTSFANQPVILTYNQGTLGRKTVSITDMRGSPVTGNSETTMWAAFTRKIQANPLRESICLIDIQSELTGNPNRLEWSEQPGELEPIAFDSSGQRLFVKQYYGSQTTIWELEVTDTTITTKGSLATIAGNHDYFAISPDSSKIALGDSDGLFTVDTSSGGVTQIFMQEVTDLTWHSDDTIVTANGSGIFLHSLDGESRLVIPVVNANNVSISLTVDYLGNLVYCQSGDTPVMKSELRTDTAEIALDHEPLGDVVTSEGIILPVVNGAAHLNWAQKPQTAEGVTISYQYEHEWTEDITEPLLTDGASTLDPSNVTPEALNLMAWIDGTWSTNTDLALQQIDSALQTLSSDRTTMGVWANRLEHRRQSKEVSVENHISASSQITDADMAWEIWQTAKAEVQLSVAIKVIQQANQLRASAMNLLFDRQSASPSLS